MTTKKKVLIIIGVVVFLLLLFLLIWFLTKQKTTPVTVIPVETNTQVAPPRDTEVEVTTPPVENVDTSLQSLAMTFAERYGSYSTESDFANLKDVLVLMSAALRASTENFIATAKASNEYYGVTTNVLSITVTSSTADAGTVEVSTQRNESKGSPQASEISYQKLLLNCVKEGGVWKVNSATWQ